MNSVLLLQSERDSREDLVVDELSQLPSRVAKLESDVGHIRADVAEIKVDIRRMDDWMRGFEAQVDAKFDILEQRVFAKFDTFDQRLNAKIDAVDARLNGKIESLQQQFSSAKVWALGLYIGLAASMLLVMSKGFKWI
jgi:chromosome segregation ATPase